jgi:hypothetical protein
VIRAAVLFAATSATFAVLESYLHWRAGLGWHGLHCLTGPVHRDAIPLLLALSVVAAALACAVEHVLAWMRRVWAAVNRRRRVDGSLPAVPLPARVCAVRPALVAAHGARGPPFLS